MKQIQILGYTYTLALDDREDASSGQCNTWAQTMRIARGQCRAQQESAVLHEIIEALDVHLELGLKHRVISQLEAGLFQVLTDNGVDLAPLIKGAR